MADQLQVDMIVKAISKGFDKVNKDLKGMGTAGEASGGKLKKMNNPMTELKSKIDLISMAASKFKQVFTKAFELGREGAAIMQTRQSFQGLLDQWEITPGYLERMNEASNNTIDDMSLMGSTLTLVAGASKELGSELLNSAPRLMEIAKAANKLNPSLGTTSFMYDSISKGIKRNSPLILDNLGIIVKVGQANKTYAESIGKTVAQLTAEEKSMALLNAVMAQGDNLITQAGGSTDSLTDSFDQLTTKLKNLADQGKTKLMPFLNDAVTAVNMLLGWTDKLTDVMLEHSEVMLKEADNYEDYIKEMIRAAVAADFLTQEEADLALQELENTGTVSRLTQGIGLLTSAQYGLAMQSPETAARQADLNERISEGAAAAEELTEAEEELEEQAEETAKQQQALADAIAAGRDRASEAAQKYQGLAEALMGMDAAEGARAQIDQLTKLLDAGKISPEEYAAAVREIKTEAGFASESSYAMADAVEILNEMTANGLIDVQNYDEAWGIAHEAAEGGEVTWGDLEQALINAGLTTQEQVDEMNGIDLGEATSEVDGLLSPLNAIHNLPDSKDFTITTTYITYGTPPRFGLSGSIFGFGGGTVPDDPDEKAAGGPVFGGTPYLVGEQGPELFMPNQSGTIVNNDQTSGLGSEIKGLRQDIRSLFGAMQASNQNTIYVNDQDAGSALLDMIRTN